MKQSAKLKSRILDSKGWWLCGFGVALLLGAMGLILPGLNKRGEPCLPVVMQSDPYQQPEPVPACDAAPEVQQEESAAISQKVAGLDEAALRQTLNEDGAGALERLAAIPDSDDRIDFFYSIAPGISRYLQSLDTLEDALAGLELLRSAGNNLLFQAVAEAYFEHFNPGTDPEPVFAFFEEPSNARAASGSSRAAAIRLIQASPNPETVVERVLQLESRELRGAMLTSACFEWMNRDFGGYLNHLLQAKTLGEAELDAVVANTVYRLGAYDPYYALLLAENVSEPALRDSLLLNSAAALARHNKPLFDQWIMSNRHREVARDISTAVHFDAELGSK